MAIVRSLKDILSSYDPNVPLAEASTIPAPWYTDERVFELEKQTVFGNSWQVAARLDQVRDPGDYVTTEIAGEPIVIVRGTDGELRGFFNVCRHHAAAVMTEAQGHATQMRCPYHGWTYSLEGALKGTPDFSGVCNFDRAENGLAPVEIATWEQWVFVRLKEKQTASLNSSNSSLTEFLGRDLITQIEVLGLENLHWIERRRYSLDCNWKVFVDNYLDGGYHVPHLHKGLDSVLDYSSYTIENGEHFCLQSSPMVSSAHDDEVGAVRTGRRALYYWLYPNFMMNYYEGVLDTNLVRPLAVNRTEVVFDFYFADVSESARERNLASINVGDRIQQEDLDICESVQRGLSSQAYEAGRLSVRREAGEHLFHRLLYADLKSAI
ncbi:MAG TPA: aromatic ring-hydroxylating dioxygenase subunit alpha [Pyrinomonadaceae bacterium]|nr:aromatic ring-hydroxylating dioxygenase subunit alpha [Pyrinomonadaceae bacterium]